MTQTMRNIILNSSLMLESSRPQSWQQVSECSTSASRAAPLKLDRSEACLVLKPTKSLPRAIQVRNRVIMYS